MITLKDKLSHLTYIEVCKLLGDEGKNLIRQGGSFEINIDDQVVLNNDMFKLDLIEANVKIGMKPAKNMELNFKCSKCSQVCEHVGAAFNFLGAMFTQDEESEKVKQLTEGFKTRLSECLERDENGKITLKVTLPDESVLDNLAKSLARMMNIER
ncbi:MAG: hypothetical protein GX654_10425 [Desulfatiglans sp.]|jgi:hypothetical protein|nr:hypothetical protein [Desulfatiglans sp.]